MLGKKKSKSKQTVAEAETNKAKRTTDSRYENRYNKERRISRSAAPETSYRFLTEAELSAGTDYAKSAAIDSQELISRLNYYEIKRMEYEIYIDKYRFGIDREAAQVRVLENQRSIFYTKIRNFRARRCEARDNRRYIRALEFKCEKGIFRRRARPATINRYKAQLIDLLKKKQAINIELSALYDERYKDYVRVETEESLLGVSLRAARSAYRRLQNVEFAMTRYNFSSEEKSRLHEYMNKFVDLSAAIATMRHRSRDGIGNRNREELRAAIAEKKKERDKLENSIFLLLTTVRRRTYLDSKRGVWRWVLGISIITLVLIALFGIFHEVLTEFLLDWATRGG